MRKMREKPVIYVREVKKDDQHSDLIRGWLEKDPSHQALGIRFDDIFQPNTDMALIYDENGPLMAARFHRALRIGMQFDPEHAYRTAKVGKEVVEWFKELAQAGNYREIIIRPGGKARAFAERLGFDAFDGQILNL